MSKQRIQPKIEKENHKAHILNNTTFKIHCHFPNPRDFQLLILSSSPLFFCPRHIFLHFPLLISHTTCIYSHTTNSQKHTPIHPFLLTANQAKTHIIHTKLNAQHTTNNEYYIYTVAHHINLKQIMNITYHHSRNNWLIWKCFLIFIFCINMPLGY